MPSSDVIPHGAIGKMPSMEGLYSGGGRLGKGPQRGTLGVPGSKGPGGFGIPFRKQAVPNPTELGRPLVHPCPTVVVPPCLRVNERHARDVRQSLKGLFLGLPLHAPSHQSPLLLLQGWPFSRPCPRHPFISAKLLHNNTACFLPGPPRCWLNKSPFLTAP